MSVLTLPQSMVRDQENQIKANAAHVDENFTALETAVNGKLDLDGSSVPTADISMGSHKLTNVATPTLSGDAATKGYVDSADTALSATCVKLSGNQTIAGTKTFSSTISGSITGNAGTVTNGVYTTGNQTIAGTKTFSSTISGSITGNAGTVTNGVYTTGDQSIAGTKTFTGTLKANSTIQGSINGSSASCTGNAATVTNGVYTTGDQTIGGTKTFSSVAYGQASDANNSLLTTVSENKSKNGYVKLGNGIIIQWGRVDNVGGSTYSLVSLPTAFSNSDYTVICCSNSGPGGAAGMMFYYDKTTTQFKLDNSNANYQDPASWIAIGW